jgi:hypothetical protein
MSEMTKYNAHLLWKSALERKRTITLDIRVERHVPTYQFHQPVKVHKDVICYRFAPRGLAIPATHWVCDVQRVRYEDVNLDARRFACDKVTLLSLPVATIVTQSLAKTLLQAVIEVDSEYIGLYADVNSPESLNVYSEV